ncbi:MAG: hypothetical protein HQL20_08170 [Candidatus Omnitrophica bacterium]|nr:hypothetical protein [Candidatus Omnitrophota bacterium]
MIPVLEKEVNEGTNFAPLRQVYQSLILAAWYKKKLKDSILAQVYVDRNKTDGVNIQDPKESEKIWAQYVEAFKKGAYNFIKEELDSVSQEAIPRKYFSGGLKMIVDLEMTTDNAAVQGSGKGNGKALVEVNLHPFGAQRWQTVGGVTVPIRAGSAQATREGNIVPAGEDDIRTLLAAAPEEIQRRLQERARAGQKPNGRPVARGVAALDLANGLMGTPGFGRGYDLLAKVVHKIQALQVRRAEIALGENRKVEELDIPIIRTLAIAEELLEIVRREMPLEIVNGDEHSLREIADLISSPLLGGMPSAESRQKWLEEILAMLTRKMVAEGQAFNSGEGEGLILGNFRLSALKPQFFTALIEALVAYGVGRAAEADQERVEGGTDLEVARGFTDRQLNVQFERNEGEDISREAIANLERIIERYLVYMQEQYAKTGNEVMKARFKDLNIPDAVKALSILADAPPEVDFIGRVFPTVLGVLEEFLLTHWGEGARGQDSLENMTDDNRLILLGMLYRGCVIAHNAGFTQAEPSLARAAGTLLAKGNATAGQRELLLNIIQFAGLTNLPGDMRNVVVRDIARMGDEGLPGAQALLAQDEAIASPGEKEQRAAKAASLLAELKDLKGLSPTRFARVREEVLALPLTESGPIAGYDPEMYGQGFEFEMAVNGDLYKPIADTNKRIAGLVRADLLSEGWKAKEAGHSQMEIVTPFFPNTGEGWRLFQEGLARIFDGKDPNIRAITSMHINTGVAPLDLPSAERAFAAVAKALEGVLYRLSRNKIALEQSDFNYVGMLPVDAVFGTSSFGWRRQMINLRPSSSEGVKKIESRHNLAPVFNNARQVNVLLLRQYVQMQFALTRYAFLNRKDINPLHLPLLVVLGMKPGPEYDVGLLRFLDKIFGDDVLGKAIFIKQYYHPVYGQWRSKGSADPWALESGVRSEYEKRGLWAVYQMHKASGGYEADPVGYIQARAEALTDAGRLDGQVAALIRIVMEQGSDLEKERLSAFLEKKGWQWIFAVEKLRNTEDVWRWLKDSPKGRAILGKDSLPLESDSRAILALVARSPELWKYLPSIDMRVDFRIHPEDRDEFVRVFLQQELTGKDIADFLRIWFFAHIEEVARVLADSPDPKVITALFSAFAYIGSSEMKLSLLTRIKALGLEHKLWLQDQAPLLKGLMVGSVEAVAVLAMDILADIQELDEQVCVRLANQVVGGNLRDRAIEILMKSRDRELRRQGLLLAVTKHPSLSVRLEAIDAYIEGQFDQNELESAVRPGIQGVWATLLPGGRLP